jgi:uncharacterized protein (DUF1800 family)
MSETTSNTSPTRWSRRALFGLGGLVATPAAAAAQLRTPAPPAPTVFQDQQLKVLRRLTYGPTPEDISQLYMYGFDNFLNAQLDPTNIDDSACDARLVPMTTLLLSPFDTVGADYTLTTNQIQEQAIARSIYSRRQLFERVVEFWSDHFTTNLNIVGVYKSIEVREVYRKHAFTKFRDLLYASFTSPAMLIYLNGAQNTRTAPNQNYAREIMELHTLGVNGGYTQQDVIEVARCLTGWQYASSSSDPRRGTAFYNSTRHDNNQKIVLGNVIAAGGGQADGDRVIDILVNHPSTHSFVAWKLLRHFISDQPSTTLVASVAETFRQSGGDIKAVLRAILTPENIQSAPPIFKRPFHLVVSAVRALGINVTSYSSLRGTQLPGMGQGMYAWATPDGFPTEYAYWGTLPLARWNYLFNLANNSVSGATFSVATFRAGAVTPAQVADRIDRVVFANEMPRDDKNALIAYLGTTTPPTNPSDSRVRDGIGLALSSPAFQWY